MRVNTVVPTAGSLVRRIGVMESDEGGRFMGVWAADGGWPILAKRTAMARQKINYRETLNSLLNN
jgi:hypothetical protein